MPPIPKMYLYAGAAVVAVLLMLAVGVSYKVAFDKGEVSGKAQCVAGVSSATAESLKKSQEGILNANKKLQAVEDQINAAPPDADGPLALVLRDQLVRMQGRPDKLPARRDSSPRPSSP